MGEGPDSFSMVLRGHEVIGTNRHGRKETDKGNEQIKSRERERERECLEAGERMEEERETGGRGFGSMELMHAQRLERMQ